MNILVSSDCLPFSVVTIIDLGASFSATMPLFQFLCDCLIHTLSSISNCCDPLCVLSVYAFCLFLCLVNCSVVLSADGGVIVGSIVLVGRPSRRIVGVNNPLRDVFLKINNANWISELSCLYITFS